MKSILFALATICLIACGGNSGNSGGITTSLDGYKTEDAGSGITYAYKADGGGNLVESGNFVNGQKSGMWLTYYDTEKDVGKVKSIASYTNGILNGPYMELSNRGQIETQVDYRNNQYHGESKTYKFGRAVSVKTYADGKLHGPSLDYHTDGTVQKEINFKDGKQHGSMKWYNEDGKVTMEYEYKNGEKVSGGIVKQEE